MIHLTRIFILYAAFSLLVIDPAFAQVPEDVLRLSPTGPVGTARIQALGGTGFSLGGDLSSAVVNPAGLGFYDRSEITFTPTFSNVSSDATYVDQSRSLTDSNLGITNFAVAFNSSRVNSSGWQGGTFAISYNRIDRSGFDFRFDPTLNSFSLLDEFAQQANGISFNDIDQLANEEQYVGYAEGAYRNFLINPVNTANPNAPSDYVPSIPEDVIADQDGTVEVNSRLSQWNLSYGGNFNDKFYIGGGIGIKSFTMDRENVFNEFYIYTDEYIDFINSGEIYRPVEGGPGIDFVNFNSLNERQELDAIGINATLGAIYRPIEEVTVGLSYQTPTAFSVSENYDYLLSSEVSGIFIEEGEPPFDVGANDDIRSSIVTSDYALTAPSRLGVGASYFVQKYGFISADVEYINYAAHRYRSDNLSSNFIDNLNNEVDEAFRSVINYRIGAEFRYDQYRLRGGYALRRSPLDVANDPLDRDQTAFSGGIGLRLPNFFADLTAVYTQYESDYRPYTYATFFPLSQTTLDNRALNVMLTLGFNF